ncbi:MAG: protein translocase subunit SecD [Candidatus Eremiobacterota bacterium]
MRSGSNLIQLALILVFCGICFWGIYDPATNRLDLKLGLDLRSGSHIALQLSPARDPVTGEVVAVTEQTRGHAIKVFQKRLNPDGTLEIQITPEGSDRLIIEIPEMTDTEKAVAMVKKVGKLEFREMKMNPATGQPEWTTVMDGRYIKKADAQPDMQGRWVVHFELTSQGAGLFGQLTQRLVNKPLGIFFDGVEISAPTVQEPIMGGSGQITGEGTPEWARDLANFLNSGALPLNVEILSSYTVSPTLGKESLESSMTAFVAGLGIIALYMCFYYRLPGFCASLALVAYAVITMASMNIPGMEFVLTLPGIAGFILSIGIAVDANVLIFERLKEELWSGKSLGHATDTGFARAWSSIWDGHVTTFIGAAILYIFGAASIKGFGLTLMVGTVWSLLTAIYITRQIMTFFLQSLRLQNRWLFGA